MPAGEILERTQIKLFCLSGMPAGEILERTQISPLAGLTKAQVMLGLFLFVVAQY
jgi:hypothetical protein